MGAVHATLVEQCLKKLKLQLAANRAVRDEFLARKLLSQGKTNIGSSMILHDTPILGWVMRKFESLQKSGSESYAEVELGGKVESYDERIAELEDKIRERMRVEFESTTDPITRTAWRLGPGKMSGAAVNWNPAIQSSMTAEQRALLTVQGAAESGFTIGGGVSGMRMFAHLGVGGGGGRAAIFADTDFLFAAQRGNVRALAEIRAGTTYVTPNQFREFLAGGPGRAEFLEAEGIRLFGGPIAGRTAGTAEFQQTFGRIVGTMGRGDAALAAFARSTGHTAVTMDGRLHNFITHTLRDATIPMRRFFR